MGLAKQRMGMAKWGIAVIKETVEDKKGIVGIRRGWVKEKAFYFFVKRVAGLGMDKTVGWRNS